MDLRVRALNSEKRICRQCELEFTPTVGNQAFHSNECRDLWYTRFPQKYYERKEAHDKVCPQCDTLFSTNNNKKRYCSAECQVDHRESTYVSKPIVKRVCARENCGVEFETTHAHKKYCSEECRRAR